MGYIAKSLNTKKMTPREDRGSRSWLNGESKKPQDGGVWGRTSTASEASFRRLLQAMRSSAPGGWSDDRWEQSKHFVGIQYVAIHRCGEQMSQAEFQVFIKDKNHPEGKVPCPENHPGYDLVRLLEKPNKDDSFGEWLYNINLQMDLTGTALTWMVPNELGVPFELYSVPTALAIPQAVTSMEYPNGFYRIQPVYPYGPFSSFPTPNSAVGAAIPSEWMLKMKYPHPYLRYDGYSPMTAMRLHIDEVESMDRSRWYSMKRSINPSAVLNFEDMEGSQPLPWEEIERIRSEFEADLEGSENAGKLFVSAPGSSLEKWGTSPIDMDYKEGWSQLVSFVLGSFGITKPAAGMIEDASYSTLFATLKQLYWLTIEPKCNRIAAKLTRHLAPFFGNDLIVEIRTRRIDDHDVMFGKLEKLMSGKAITKNEMRHKLDFPITNEKWGNEIAGEGGQEQKMQERQLILQQQQVDQQKQQSTEEDEIKLEQNREEPLAVTEARPQPDRFGRGSLGPRMKNLSFYDSVRKAIHTNGVSKNGKH